MNGMIFKAEIERIFKEAREKYPNITDNMLDTNGAIYYMNGNDSTPFDWHVNDHLCEFYIFHKNERGFIKVFVNRNNMVQVFIFEDGGWNMTYKYTEPLQNVKAYDFACIMNHIADEKYLWDKPIDELDWNVSTMECEDIDEDEDEDDDEDW